MQDIYVNPFTEFGFKKLFAVEQHKELLTSLLNTLLPEKHQIEHLQYVSDEQRCGETSERKEILELSCTSLNGEQFIVELQKVKQNYFKSRDAYYATFPRLAQAKQGNRGHKLSAVYAIGILDFVFKEDRMENGRQVVHTVSLENQFAQASDETLTVIYVALPNFKKTLSELETTQDKWLYIFQHLHEMDEIPEVLEEPIFSKLFEVARLASFTSEEQETYEYSLKYYRDLNNVADAAREAGFKAGLAEALAQRESRATH